MRTSRRALIAAVVAVCAHAIIALVIRDSAVRTLALPPQSTRVELAFAAPRSEAAPPRVPAVARPHDVASAPAAEHAAHASTPARELERAAPPSAERAASTSAAPETARAPEVASAPEATRGAVIDLRRHSDLEREIGGSAAGPRPSLEVLDPSLKRAGVDESESARAQRAVNQVARVDALPRDSGPVKLELVPTDGGGYSYTTGGFVAEIHEDGTVSFTNRDFSAALGGPGMDGDPAHHVAASGTVSTIAFDPTAALMRAGGKDPYAAERSCFLDDTLELRADLREKHEAKQMVGLRRALERAWFDEPGSPTDRRAALFALWDDCREDGIGQRGRQLVESFIRQHLPEGSADAFTAAEITALNARRSSTAEFHPYG